MAKLKSKTPAVQRKHIVVSAIHYPQLEYKPYAPARQIPYIRLRGLWLAEAGFAPQDRVEVLVEAGRVVLTRR